MGKIDCKVLRISGDPIELSLKNGDQLFIVGPNGSGKSALIQQFVSEIGGNKIKRISAHRQTWLPSGTINLTPAQRKDFERQNFKYNRNYQSRYADPYAETELSAILFDLDNKYNIINESIAQDVRQQNMEKATETALESPSPFDQINELLDHSRLTVKLERAEDRSILARHLRGESFDIAKMSDGERSAAIIASHVITADPETVFLIDEPEKHLHRSISQPFLSALFDLRKDCIFIISTHEIDLTLANPEARVLMLRSCQWNDNECIAWDAEVLGPNSQLPEKLRLTEELKRAVLGSRKRILFVEGDSSSLDFQLYTALFPNLSVIPKGSCENVQKAVLGLRESQEVHDVEAFGLIDGDNRGKEVEKLTETGVYALEMYSVDSLYYRSEVIAAIAHQRAEFWEDDANGLIELAQQEAIEVLKDHDLAARMAARRCERQVQELFLSKIPNWKSIMTISTQPICISIDPDLYSKELEHFNVLVDKGELDGLITRYPLRESQVFETIIKTIRCENKKHYQRMVVKLVQDDKRVAECLKKHIGQLSEILEP